MVSFRKSLPMLLLPIAAPLLGAGIVFLTRDQTARVRWLAYLASVIGTWLIAGALFLFIPASQQISVWQPRDVFPTPLTLKLDTLSWVALFSAATVLLAVALTAEARSGEGPAGLRAMLLVYTAFSCMAFLGGDLVTLALGWVLTDLIGFGFLIILSSEHEGVETLATRAAVLMTSSLFVFAGAALQAGSSHPPTAAVWLWLLAVLLRIGLIPLHVTLPQIPGVRRGVGALVRLFPPAMAVILLARAPAYTPDALASAFLLLVSALGVLVGGVRWSLHLDAVEGRPFFVLGITALAPLLLLGADGASHTGLAGLVALLLLAGGSISIYQAHVGWHRAWPALLSLMLLGVPFTAGAAIPAALLAMKTPAGQSWPTLLIGAASMIVAALGAYRLSREGETRWLSGEDAIRTAYTIGQSAPLVALVLIGAALELEITSLTALLFLALLGLTVLAIELLRRTVEPRRRLLLRRLGSAFEFSGPYLVLRGALEVLGKIVQLLGTVIEGGPAILWALVILMTIGLITAGGGR